MSAIQNCQLDNPPVNICLQPIRIRGLAVLGDFPQAVENGYPQGLPGRAFASNVEKTSLLAEPIGGRVKSRHKQFGDRYEFEENPICFRGAA